MAQSQGLTTEESFPWLDQSGLAALLAGSFVVLITFFTSYSHVDIPSHESVEINQQIGIPLLLADSPRNRLQLSETLGACCT